MDFVLVHDKGERLYIFGGSITIHIPAHFITRNHITKQQLLDMLSTWKRTNLINPEEWTLNMEAEDATASMA